MADNYLIELPRGRGRPSEYLKLYCVARKRPHKATKFHAEEEAKAVLSKLGVKGRIKPNGQV